MSGNSCCRDWISRFRRCDGHEDRGLLDETLVVCVGEMGRTPKPDTAAVGPRALEPLLSGGACGSRDSRRHHLGGP